MVFLRVDGREDSDTMDLQRSKSETEKAEMPEPL